MNKSRNSKSDENNSGKSVDELVKFFRDNIKLQSKKNLLDKIKSFFGLQQKGIVFATEISQKDYTSTLLEKYNDKIMIGEKSIGELIEFLKTKADIREIPLSEISAAYIAHMIFNISLTERFKRMALKDDDLEFMAFKIPRNNNDNFYNSYTPLHGVKDVHIVFETKTNSIYCECSKLQLELYIYEGINQYDFDNKTDALRNYLNQLDFLEKGQY